MSEPEPLEDSIYSVKTKLSKAQLEAIGTVAAAYNDVEVYVNVIVATVLFLGDEALEVTSRINGIEGKLDIIKAKLKRQKLPNNWYVMICDSLAAFHSLKKERDKVIHARVIRDTVSPAITFARRGKYLKTLLSEEFLQGIYIRLVDSKYEMASIFEVTQHWTLMERVQYLTGLMVKTDGSNETVALANKLRENMQQTALSRVPTSLAKLQERQKHRLALPPLPELPEEGEAL